MRNVFLEKSSTECGKETCPRPFFKKSKFSISLDQQSEVLHSLFLSYVQVEKYQNILELKCWPLAFTSYKAFLKKILSLPILCMMFKGKYFSRYILLTDQISFSDCLHLFRYWPIYALYYNCLFLSLWRLSILKWNLAFLSRRFAAWSKK